MSEYENVPCSILEVWRIWTSKIGGLDAWTPSGVVEYEIWSVRKACAFGVWNKRKSEITVSGKLDLVCQCERVWVRASSVKLRGCVRDREAKPRARVIILILAKRIPCVLWNLFNLVVSVYFRFGELVQILFCVGLVSRIL